MEKVVLFECPRCHSDYVNPDAVQVFFRDKEDSDCGLHVVVDKPDRMSYTDSSMSGNPSPRRDGLKVQMHCEGCGKMFDIDIYAHKGRTVVREHIDSFED